MRPPVIDLKADETPESDKTADEPQTEEFAQTDPPAEASATEETVATEADTPKQDAGDDKSPDQDADADGAIDQDAGEAAKADDETAVETKPDSDDDATPSDQPNQEEIKSADADTLSSMPDTPVPPPAANKTGMIAGGVALLVIAAVVLGAWLYRAYGPVGPQMAEVSALRDRIDSLETSAKANTGKLSELTQSAAALGDRLSKLETSLAALQTAGSDNLASVEKSIEELRTALTAAAASGEGGSAGQAQNKLLIDELTQKLTGLNTRVAEAEGALQSAPASVDPAAVSALQTKLAAVEQSFQALQKRQEQLATQTSSDLGQAYAQLSSRLASSDPFAAELDALVSEAPAVPGLEVLRNFATNGVTSRSDLAAELDKMAAALNAAKPTAGDDAAADDSLMGKLTARLTTVVKIRKIDDVDWPGVLTTAAGDIRSGQLAKSLSLLASQPGTAPEALEAWIKRAEDRVKVDQAMERLSKAVLARLAASGQSG